MGRKVNNLNGTLKQGKSLMDEVICFYGTDNEKLQAIEKLSSLIQIISYYECSPSRNMKIRNSTIAQKMAEVMVCLSELKLIYKISDIDINSYVESRLASIDCDLQQRLYNHLRRYDTEIGLL